MSTDGDYSSQDDKVYANNEIKKLANVSKLLKTTPLSDLLEQNKVEVEKEDEIVTWYHGKISREAAESILHEGLLKQGDGEGLFIVRDSTVSATDYALSLVCKGKTFHFQIQKKCEGFYHIDDGPVIHGLDNLVKHYEAKPNGLPTKLTTFCKGTTPPSISRKHGPTNLLHRAVLEGNAELVKKLLSYPLCPDVNAKNLWGSTALHDASYYGFDDVIALLLAKGTDVTLKDGNGHTSLHRACVANHPSTVAVLMKDGRSNPEERCPQTGWVAMHEAAMKGHAECIKMLLEFGATPFPRSDDKETPLDLAFKYGRRDCIKLLQNYQLPPVPTKQKDWFHPEIDRQGATKKFELHGLRDGLFLVRPSKRHLGWHVLSLCHCRTTFNYEIRNENYKDMFVHYIDDGPYLLSLEHVIFHYSRQNDGLPCLLLASLSPSNEIIEVPKEDTYYNTAACIERQPSQIDAFKPDLPPRPWPVQEEGPRIKPHQEGMGAASPAPTNDQYSQSHKPTGTGAASPTPARVVSSPPPPPTMPPPSKGKLDNLRKFLSKNIKIGHELGQGEYGSVLKGTLYQKSKSWLGGGEKIEVAIKTFHEGSVENAEDFLREARVMQSLQHPCIVRLLGVCETPTLMLLEEYVAIGSMLDYLLDYPDDINVKTNLYLWACQIAAGMMYLEKQRLVHRDLAARNILLQSKAQAKISDFGLSRAVGAGSDYYKASHGGRWPIKWYAPESVNYGHFSHSSDVWSYGVTLWEMFSFGESPYGDMKGIEVVQFIERGRRLDKPEKCPETAYNMMLQCWQIKPERRPTFEHLNKHFEENPEYSSIQDLIRH